MDSYALGLDVGNTHYKIGVIQDGEVKAVFRFRTEMERSVDEYYFQLKAVCNEHQLPDIPPIWGASVVPSVKIAFDQLAQMRRLKLSWIDQSHTFSYQIHPQIQRQIGADILILAEAAVRRKGSDVIIVCAGTATTVFAVHEGVLLGGAIAPGIKGAVESLIRSAALLNPVFFELPENPIGQNTDEAMRSGILYGFAGLIDNLVDKMRQQLGYDDMPVIASGGMIGRIVKASRTLGDVYPDLGMQGIAALTTERRA